MFQNNRWDILESRGNPQYEECVDVQNCSDSNDPDGTTVRTVQMFHANDMVYLKFKKNTQNDVVFTTRNPLELEQVGSLKFVDGTVTKGLFRTLHYARLVLT